jgi:hypothetical protein
MLHCGHRHHECRNSISIILFYAVYLELQIQQRGHMARVLTTSSAEMYATLYGTLLPHRTQLYIAPFVPSCT